MRDEQRTVLNGIANIVAKELGLDRSMVKCEEVTRANGKKIGLFLPPMDDGKFSPFYHLDEHVEAILRGEKTPEDVAGDLVNMIRNYKNPFGGDAEINIDRDFILSRCKTKVVSAERNPDLLQNTPHNLVCDLAEIVIVPVQGVTGEVNGYITVTNDVMEMAGIEEGELFDAARERVSEDTVVKSLASILGVMFGGTELEGEEDDTLFVATNEDNLYGAAAIGCPSLLNRIRRQIGGDVYVIPSSVHEILLIKKDSVENGSYIVGIIKDVNKTVVSDEDFLSDNLYEVDEEGNVHIAA